MLSNNVKMLASCWIPAGKVPIGAAKAMLLFLPTEKRAVMKSVR
jgi:hypothetical protein